MDIDDVNFGQAQMCAVGNAEPEPTPKPAAACAQCVVIALVKERRDTRDASHTAFSTVRAERRPCGRPPPAPRPAPAPPARPARPRVLII